MHQEMSAIWHTFKLLFLKVAIEIWKSLSADIEIVKERHDWGYREREQKDAFLSFTVDVTWCQPQSQVF